MRGIIFLGLFLAASVVSLASQPKKSSSPYPQIHFTAQEAPGSSRIKVPDRLQLLFEQRGMLVVEVRDREDQLWMKRRTEAQHGEMLLPFKRLPEGVYTVRISDGHLARTWTILHEI